MCVSELKNAINEVYNNNSWFSSELMQKVISKLNTKTKKNKSTDLSERELEILHLICESLTNDQIASKLNLSSETVKWHRSNLLEKTGCFNTAGLVIYAIKNQLIEV